MGCPRSGTTLVQSLMSAHPLLFSFPESHFFPNIISENIAARIFGLASKKANQHAKYFFKLLSKNDLPDSFPLKAKRVKSYVTHFANLLDMITLEKNKQIWMEKTPQHLHYIKLIERYIRDTKFFHVIRNGEDVVASLYEVTHKYPEVWGGTRTIDRCVKRWIIDANITRKYISRQNHLVIKYEELVKDPEKIIRHACEFIGIKFRRAMINESRLKASKLLFKEEIWKQDVQGPIKNSNGKKIYTVFNHQERQYVRKLLGGYIELSF